MTIDTIIEKLESLHAASTQGPLKTAASGDYAVVEEPSGLRCAIDLLPGDAEFWVTAHNLLPQVLAEVRWLRDVLTRRDWQLVDEVNLKWKAQRGNTALKAEVERLRAALDMAVYDLERIRDANWDANQMRMGARSGASVAKAALGESK